MKTEHKIILLSFLVGAFMWLADAALDYLFFYRGYTFWSLAATEVPPHEMYVRICAVVLVVVFGFVTARLVANLRDARDRNAVEKERLAVTLGSIGDAVIASDKQGSITALNAAAERLTGWSEQEAIGLPLATVFHIINETTRAKCENPVEKVLETGEIVGLANDTVLVAKDGTERIIADSGAPIQDAHGFIIGAVIVFRDVTEEKRAERALRKNEQMLAQIIDFLPDAAFVIDKDGTVVAWNRAIENLTGVKACDMLGMGNFEYSLAFYPERRPVLIDAALKPDREIEQCYLHVRWEGDVLVSESDSSQLKIPGVHLWNRARALNDGQGNIIGAVETIRDITNQKKAYETAVQAERLKAIVDLAGGVAHNFNNLLQIVVGGLDLALMDMENNNISDARTTLEQVLEGCKFGTETVRRLQSFADVRKDLALTGSEVFDLSDVVQQAANITTPWWKTGPEKNGIPVRLSLELENGCTIRGKRNEIFELLVNLIKNAAEALPAGGTISLATALQEGRVVLRVSDTGVGIPCNDLKKVFEPFWSTKHVAAGTGMGLTVCHGIVIRHGGSITVESVESGGTTVTVWFPQARTVPEPHAARTVQPLDVNLTILVVDDMIPVVTMVDQILSRHGQRVLRATGGQEALAFFEENRVDLVICDLSMPGMNGWDVFKTMKQICVGKNIPKPPFILLTGWGGQAVEEFRMRESGVDIVLEKPLDASKILAAVRDAKTVLSEKAESD